MFETVVNEIAPEIVVLDEGESIWITRRVTVDSISRTIRICRMANRGKYEQELVLAVLNATV